MAVIENAIVLIAKPFNEEDWSKMLQELKEVTGKFGHAVDPLVLTLNLDSEIGKSLEKAVEMRNIMFGK